MTRKGGYAFTSGYELSITNQGAYSHDGEGDIVRVQHTIPRSLVGMIRSAR
jgi:hypothetical protein